MKYDKMVECSLERSKQKVETAKREIQEMLESKEKITVAALIQKTGFSKGFFYRNEEMRRVVNEATSLVQTIFEKITSESSGI